MNFIELPRAARLFDRIYNRTPRGIARVCVAAASGALFAIYAAVGGDWSAASQYWYLFAGWGLMVGLVGGTVLGVLERRAAVGQAPPLWWSVFRNVALTFLYVLGLLLLLLLFYVMVRLVHDEHLYGF